MFFINRILTKLFLDTICKIYASLFDVFILFAKHKNTNNVEYNHSSAYG